VRRATEDTSPDVLVVAASLAGAVLGYLDLLGADLAVWDDWGDRSLFSFGAVLAFLAPTAIVLRLRHERRRGTAWIRWPDVIIGAAATALAVSVVARAIGEGSLAGLLAAVAGAAATAYAATRVRP
jgi:hypothetical protein